MLQKSPRPIAGGFFVLRKRSTSTAPESRYSGNQLGCRDPEAKLDQHREAVLLDNQCIRLYRE